MTGTFGWELAVIKARGLDKAAGLDLQIVDLANTEAGKIAMAGGVGRHHPLRLAVGLARARARAQADILALFERARRADGQERRPVAALGDLKGRTLGVAGGPLDKSWLLLQAFAKRGGFDVAHEAKVAFAAPPLLSQKAQQGELDATLQFWNFCADLEGKGFKRIVEVSDIEKSLGAKGSVAIVGSNT